MKSLSLSDLKTTTGTMNGKTKILIGKNVIVTPPLSKSKLELFLSLIIFIRLKAARFL